MKFLMGIYKKLDLRNVYNITRMIESNVKGVLEDNIDNSEVETLKILKNIFDYSEIGAVIIYKNWRKEYRSLGYRTEESKLTKEEKLILKKLDKAYYKNKKRQCWW